MPIVGVLRMPWVARAKGQLGGLGVVPREMDHRALPEVVVACITPFQSPQYTIPSSTMGWADIGAVTETFHPSWSWDTFWALIDVSFVYPVRATLPW
jgi:hypothetical protein